MQGSFDVGDSEDPSHQSWDPGEAGGELGDSEGRTRLDLRQRIPGYIPDICHAHPGSGASDQKVCNMKSNSRCL